MTATALKIQKSKITDKLYINETALYVMESKINFSKEIFSHILFTFMILFSLLITKLF